MITDGVGSNRTFMELKLRKAAFVETQQPRSNRTFMELKQLIVSNWGNMRAEF